MRLKYKFYSYKKDDFSKKAYLRFGIVMVYLM